MFRSGSKSETSQDKVSILSCPYWYMHCYIDRTFWAEQMHSEAMLANIWHTQYFKSFWMNHGWPLISKIRIKQFEFPVWQKLLICQCEASLINLKILIIPPKPHHKVSFLLESRIFREENKIYFPKQHQIKFFSCYTLILELVEMTE